MRQETENRNKENKKKKEKEVNIGVKADDRQHWNIESQKAERKLLKDGDIKKLFLAVDLASALVKLMNGKIITAYEMFLLVFGQNAEFFTSSTW